MKKLKLTTILLLIACLSINSKTLTIQPINDAVNIDGVADESIWNSIAFNEMDQHKGEPVNKNNTAKYKMCYNVDYIFVYVEVTDNYIDTSQSANIWEKDNVELHLSMDTTTGYFYDFKNGFYNLFKVYGRNMININYPINTKGILVAEQTFNGGYSQEWRLPIDSLANTTKNFNKIMFKMDIQNADNDGSGRNSQLFWNSNADDQWCSNRNMGIVYLGGNNPLLNPHKSLNINQIDLNININGIDDDYAWSMFNFNSLDQVNGTGIFNNNTAKFKMTYDTSNIYVLAEVSDSKFDTSQSAKFSDKDGIALYFNMDTTTRMNLINGQDGFYCIRKVLGRDVVNPAINSFNVDEMEVAGGYVQEWSFPIKALASTTSKFNNKVFRFEIENDDNDGSGCSRRLFWNSNAYDQETSSQNQGFVYLKEKTGPPVNPPFITTNKHLDVYNALSPVTLDGNGYEDVWHDITYNDMNVIKGDEINKNNTAKFKMTYDDNFVYIFVSILDSYLDTSQSKNIWEKDCVEVFFSMDTTSSLRTPTGTNGFWQLRKVFGRPSTDYTSKGFLAYEVETFAGRTQEWKLSFDSLASTLKNNSKWNKKDFRFECVNSDNDGFGRNSQLFWNSNADDCWGPSNRNLGYVTLIRTDNIKPTEKSAIRIRDNYVQFPEKTNYTLYNTAGIVIRQGYKSNGFSIADLKKGIYIIYTEKEHVKICK